MRQVITLVAGILLAAAGMRLRAQTTTKPAAKTATKHAAKTSASKPAATSPATSAKEPEAKGARRDPFESLVGREKAQADLYKNLPPGKAGLLVASLRLDGI